MGKQKNTPKLRFPDFKEEWETKNFGEVVKINQGLQIAISERFLEKVDNSHFYITNEFLKEKSEKKFFIKDPPKSVLCCKDDILMTRTGNTGMVVSNVEGAFHNNFFKIAYPAFVNKDFLIHFLVLPKTQSKILKMAGTSTIPDLNHSDFYKIHFIFPSLPEQQKIASFLTSVDERIAQLTKKKALLEQYKKGVMQKIFSQEIRFKDDNGKEFGEWKEFKLGELGQTYNGLTGKNKDDFGTGFPFVTYKQIFDNSIIDSSRFEYVSIKNGENQNKVLYGDVFFTTSSETPNEVGFSSILLENIDNLYLNSFCFGYRIKSFKILSPLFASFLFRNRIFRIEVEKLAQGSTRYNMSKTELMKLTVSLPCFEEQTKIANFLSAIDKKIEGVAEVLEATQRWKKGLLQQMFC